MNYEKIFSHSVTAILLGLAGYHQSATLAYAAVASLAVGAIQEIYNRMLVIKEQKPGLNDDVKRAMQDMNARIATLEYGVKTRGF
jgi:hypothetical protein